MEFDGAIHGSVDFEDAGCFVAVVAYFAVSVVVAEDDVIFIGEVDCFFEKGFVDGGCCWVVGVVEEHHLDFLRFDGGEVGFEAVLLQ